MTATIFEQINDLAGQKIPFVVLIDYKCNQSVIYPISSAQQELFWETPFSQHLPESSDSCQTKKLDFQSEPVNKLRYTTAFQKVKKAIYRGDSYLLNLTMPSRIHCNYSLQELFNKGKSLYKVYLKDQFVSFSPEIFIRIDSNQLSTFPMKGTIDADLPNAALRLKNDPKEKAEHHTIVDLLRNDLSQVANQISVKRLAYIEKIETSHRNILQMSSEITAQTPENYPEQLGTILQKLLPAGSITGAPKQKTCDLIDEIENYPRNYYTGIFGLFDGSTFDSCILIRYFEQNEDQLIYKSGGGITFQSQEEDEYNELIQKIYVPVTRNDQD